MMHKLTFRAMLLSGVCLLPLGAWRPTRQAAPAAPGAPGDGLGQRDRFRADGDSARTPVSTAATTASPSRALDGFFGFNLGHARRLELRRHALLHVQGSDINFQFGDNLGTANVPEEPYARSPRTSRGPMPKHRTASSSGHQRLQRRPSEPDRQRSGAERHARFKVGDQGQWGIIGYYDAISYTGNIIDSIYTINGATGLSTPASRMGRRDSD